MIQRVTNERFQPDKQKHFLSKNTTVVKKKKKKVLGNESLNATPEHSNRLWRFCNGVLELLRSSLFTKGYR